MAYDHSACDHPRTPAGRAVCRKQRAKGAQPAAETRTPVVPTPRTATTPRSSSAPLKRDGTRLRTKGDLADVPRVFTPAIETAWSKAWVVRVGDRYNDTERRVEIFGTRGVVTLIWLDANPHGVNGVTFRPNDSSVTTKTPSVNEALRMAGAN